MNDGLDFLQGPWQLAALLALGFPLLIVILTELSFALTRIHNPMASSVRSARNWLAPSLALALFLRWVLRLPADHLWVHIADTLCWAAGIIVLLGAVNSVVFENAPIGSWQLKVPKLLRDLLRLLLVAIAIAMVYSIVWDREIQGALAALGLTSIVVGLALQEPLGNLFSGLMLLMERPFEVGESIEVGGVSGTVKEVNWRSVHIASATGLVQIVPNSVLNKETINNYSRPKPLRMERVEVNFSLDDPPNEVCQALKELMRGVEGIVKTSRPIADTKGYNGYAVTYEMVYHTHEDDRWKVRNDLVTRLWYMARRHGFTMPYPVRVNVNHAQDGPFAKPEVSGAELVLGSPRSADFHGVTAQNTRSLIFGRGERVFDEGDELKGVYLVVSGEVALQVVRDDHVQELGRIGAGGFFGEAGMYGRQRADMRAVALQDTSVVVIVPEAVQQLFEANPKLARDTGQSLEVHRKALQSVREAMRRRDDVRLDDAAPDGHKHTGP